MFLRRIPYRKRSERRYPTQTRSVLLKSCNEKLISISHATLVSRELRQQPNSRMHSVHTDHKQELEILSGPPKPNYGDIVLTTYRRELKIILIALKSNYRRRHSTYRTYLWSNIQRYQSIRARNFDWPPEIEHQSNDLLQSLFMTIYDEKSHENNEL